MTASMSIGSMLAIPFVPYTADILGRRTGVVIGCSIMIVGVALICMGFHIALFIVGRLILGFGIAIAHGSAPLLIAELVHPQHRAVYSTVVGRSPYTDQKMRLSTQLKILVTILTSRHRSITHYGILEA